MSDVENKTEHIFIVIMYDDYKY